MKEIYKDYYYKGIKTKYMVSNKGNVYSNISKKVLKPGLSQQGYLRIGIYLPTHETKRLSVHVMVLETFVGPKPSDDYQVDHIDGDKTNNNVNNLEWVTPSENISRAFKNGLKEAIKGSDHPVSVYTENQIHNACKLLESGLTIPEVADKVNIPKSYLYNIAKGKHWNHIVSQYDLSHINKITTTPKEIKDEIGYLLNDGMKKYQIIQYLNEKYGGDYKNVVYNYGRY